MPEGMISPREPAPIRLNRGNGTDRPPHRCGDGCVCPDHQTALYYSRQFDAHACPHTDCRYAHGLDVTEPGFESVRIMRLQPGDVIVVQVGYPVSQKDIDWFTARLERTFPGHKAVMLDNGTEISIARPDADLGSVKPNQQTTVDGE